MAETDAALSIRGRIPHQHWEVRSRTTQKQEVTVEIVNVPRHR